MNFTKLPNFLSRYKKYLLASASLAALVLGLFATLELAKNSQDIRKMAKRTSGTNVVVFMIDDLDSASFYQLINNNKLPNIKNYLIDKGVTFNNSFVTESICCSSRATFLTGKYSHNTGVYNVTGAEGGEYGFRNYDSNLPVWLSTLGYHTGMVGKYMNMNQSAHGNGARPGWDYWRNVRGYDSRPGMYSVVANDGSTSYPDYYQPKYMAETIEDFLDQYPQDFFLYVTPHSPHINLPVWQNNNSALNFTSEITNTSSQFLAFNEYQTSLNGTKKRQVLKKAGSVYRIYESNLQADGSWSGWNLITELVQPFPGTNDDVIISHNIFYFPDNSAGYREQLIRGTGASQQIFYRDNTPAALGVWFNLGYTSSIFTGTGSLPIINFSATQLETNNILQSLLRGSRALGYELYTRARLSEVWTGWTVEPGSWEANSSYGDIAAIGTNQTAPGIIQTNLIRKDNAGVNYVAYLQTRRSFYADFSEVNNSNLKSNTNNVPLMHSYYEEDQMFGGESAFPETPSTGTDLHLYWSGRVYAEGNWPNLKSYQTFGGSLPVGSLRQSNDPDGFIPISSNFNLPGQDLANFNNQANNCTGKNPWLCANWTDLNQLIDGGRPLQDYVQRQHLDRLESMLSIDALVGNVLSLLSFRGSLENTLVIFASDNGMFMGDFTLGNKMLPYENSLRVPLIIKPPQSLPVAKINNNTVLNLDLAPTILDYVGANWSDNAYNVDGRSLAPLIQAVDPLVPDWRKWFLIEWRYPRAVAGENEPHSSVNNPAWQWAWAIPDLAAVRSGLEVPGDQGGNSLYFNYTRDPLGFANRAPFTELYDLAADPVQVNNLYNNAANTVNPAYTAIFQLLSSLISPLQSCSGQSCRQADQTFPPPPTPTPSPLPAYKVFNSSTQYNGSLGGLTEADAKCQARAGAAGLTGTFKAWLSTSAPTPVDAKDRLPNVKYVLVDGTTTVANNKADLIDGSIQNRINKNEFGDTVSNSYVWTGTLWNGTKGSHNCSNWTNSTTSYSGVGGRRSRADELWTNYGNFNCNASNLSLYCFQTSTSPPPPTPTSVPTTSPTPTPTRTPTPIPTTPTPTPSPLPAYKVFNSSTQYNGSLGGLTEADAKCQARAGAAGLTGTFQAWLSTSTVDAKDRLPNVKYVLVDGTTTVANNKADLIDGSIQNRINKNEFGGMVSNLYAWTGTLWNGTKGSHNCSNWTNLTASYSGVGGRRSRADELWTNYGNFNCNASNLSLYCFQTSASPP